MPKKEWTDEERAAFGAKMKAAKVAKQSPIEDKEEEVFDKTDFQEPDLSNAEILRQLKEVQESNALLQAALLRGGSGGDSLEVKGNRLVGEVEKYIVNPANYPDPTPRLAQEPRLNAVNFVYNYELDYEFVVPPSYETKAGINIKEPRFIIQLNRIKLDDQGNQTNQRYIARRLVFHEDPQAALIVAHDNGITVDSMDEKAFLDEMRYLRTRDWLFGYFWPQAAQAKEGIMEEVIGGSIVQVFTKSTPADAPDGIDFDKLPSKMAV